MKKLILALAVAATTNSALAANYIRVPLPKIIGELASHPAVPVFGGEVPVPEPEQPVVPPKGSLDGLVFGSLPAGSILELDALLRNSGEVPLGLNVAPGAESLTGSNAFSFVSTSCAATLAAAESCAIKVRFTAPAQVGDLASVLQLDTAAGSLTASLSGTSTSPTLTYTLGAAGGSVTPGTYVQNNPGTPGGATTFTYAGVSVSAGGGAGGRLGIYYQAAAGGVGTGGTARFTGGNGAMGGSGGGGGGGISGVSATVNPDASSGGHGGAAADFGGLKAAVVAANFAFGTPGSGATYRGNVNAEYGEHAGGAGGGGGGAGAAGGIGGNGFYGGGGGGGSGNGGSFKGGSGGQGIIVVLFADSTAVILTSGSSYTPSKAVKRIWAVGAGGGGAGSTYMATTGGGGGGGGGGAGAVVYQEYP